MKTGGANLFLPDMLYDTAVLQLLAPSLNRYFTETHIYVRPPGARPPQWTFAGRDNNEEDFHLLEGKAVSCPRPDGYLVKAAVAWLPFPPDWLPAPGARLGCVCLLLCHITRGCLFKNGVEKFSFLSAWLR